MPEDTHTGKNTYGISSRWMDGETTSLSRSQSSATSTNVNNTAVNPKKAGFFTRAKSVVSRIKDKKIDLDDSDFLNMKTSKSSSSLKKLKKFGRETSEKTAATSGSSTPVRTFIPAAKRPPNDFFGSTDNPDPDSEKKLEKKYSGTNSGTKTSFTKSRKQILPSRSKKITKYQSPDRDTQTGMNFVTPTQSSEAAVNESLVSRQKEMEELYSKLETLSQENELLYSKVITLSDQLSDKSQKLRKLEEKQMYRDRGSVVNILEEGLVLTDDESNVANPRTAKVESLLEVKDELEKAMAKLVSERAAVRGERDSLQYKVEQLEEKLYLANAKVHEMAKIAMDADQLRKEEAQENQQAEKEKSSLVTQLKELCVEKKNEIKKLKKQLKTSKSAMTDISDLVTTIALNNGYDKQEPSSVGSELEEQKFSDISSNSKSQKSFSRLSQWTKKQINFLAQRIEMLEKEANNNGHKAIEGFQPKQVMVMSTEQEVSDDAVGKSQTVGTLKALLSSFEPESRSGFSSEYIQAERSVGTIFEKESGKVAVDERDAACTVIIMNEEGGIQISEDDDNINFQQQEHSKKQEIASKLNQNVSELINKPVKSQRLIKELENEITKISTTSAEKEKHLRRLQQNESDLKRKSVEMTGELEKYLNLNLTMTQELEKHRNMIKLLENTVINNSANKEKIERQCQDEQLRLSRNMDDMTRELEKRGDMIKKLETVIHNNNIMHEQAKQALSLKIDEMTAELGKSRELIYQLENSMKDIYAREVHEISDLKMVHRESARSMMNEITKMNESKTVTRTIVGLKSLGNIHRYEIRDLNSKCEEIKAMLQEKQIIEEENKKLIKEKEKLIQKLYTSLENIESSSKERSLAAESTKESTIKTLEDTVEKYENENNILMQRLNQMSKEQEVISQRNDRTMKRLTEANENLRKILSEMKTQLEESMREKSQLEAQSSRFKDRLEFLEYKSKILQENKREEIGQLTETLMRIKKEKENLQQKLSIVETQQKNSVEAESWVKGVMEQIKEQENNADNLRNEIKQLGILVSKIRESIMSWQHDSCGLFLDKAPNGANLNLKRFPSNEKVMALLSVIIAIVAMYFGLFR